VKHHRPHGVGRACRSHEKDPRRAAPASTPAVTTPARSHKRAKPADPSSVVLTPSPPPLTPVVPTSLHDRNSWMEQGWKMVRGNHSRVSVMQNWHQLVTSKQPGGFEQWKEMRAQFFEQDMRQPLSNSRLEQQRAGVVSNAEALARELLDSLGADESSLQLSDIGCLRTDRHFGLQEIHCDIQKFEYAHLCYIVLFYLCDTESTAVADVLRDELDPVWKMTIPEATRRFKSVRFLTERVAVGDALVMNGKTFHYGVGNPDPYQRYVGFLSFTPKALPPFDSQEQFYPTGTRSPVVIPRQKRPYESLQPTQRWKRRKKAQAAVAEVLEETGVPLEAIHAPPIASPAELIHLPTSIREQIRTVPSLHIPCEQSMINCKQLLATSHATETGTFAGGAFITDPVRFVSVLCAQSPFIAVGGDAGGGHTKLGVTYSIPSPTAANPDKTTQHFACLLVYEGSDSWLELQDCRAEGLTPFVGDSAAFPHIWAVLQHFIDTRGAFLNGDWCFINAVLGLMAPSATHPCPICIISKSSLLHSARYRTPADKHSIDRTHQPLLTTPPERIVPTPLHLFLGISNRIILDAFSELLGKERIEAALKSVTTVHSAGCSGASDLHDLNGPEIRKWIKRECSATLLTAAAASSTLTAATRASHSILTRWLQQLHDCLLHKDDWGPEDIEAWRSVVDDIWQHWPAEAKSQPFPKLHMLRHAVDFAERHRFLGRASEAQIESFHASFNALFHKQHRNQSSNTAERLRRSLADATLRAVQPSLNL
jgi:hypothetical protein